MLRQRPDQSKCKQGREQFPLVRDLSDYYWAVSNYNANELNEYSFGNGSVLPLMRNYKRLLEIEPCRETTEFMQRDRRKTLLFVGRVVPNKAHHDLLFLLKQYYDFVELYNDSESVLDLEGLILLNNQSESSNREKVINQRIILFPGEYVVLTPEPDDIAFRYNVPDPQTLVDNNLPTLPDRAGNFTLIYQGSVIDSFSYQSDFHSSLLARLDGISLERISFKAPASDRGNWHSASSTVGFATPGYQNSQYVDRPSFLDEMIALIIITKQVR